MKKERTEDKQYTEGIAIRGGFAGKLDNFWYHYKWITIGVAFFVIVALICMIQMCNKEENDLVVVYAGPTQLSTSEAQDVSNALEAMCPSDFDKSGKISVALSAYCVMSEQQIKDEEKQTDVNGESTYIDRNYYSQQYDTYYNYITTGESSILLLDPWLYQALAKGDRLVSLSEALGYTPDGAYGEYGIKLVDTKLYQKYGVMKKLPSDTVVCLLKPYVVGKSSKEKYYAREQEMFEAVVGKED